MKDDHAHPLLQQTALTVNPFIDLPKTPTLPHNYATIPSTLPPSALHSNPSPTAPGRPAYITSPTGDFAAHPQTLLEQSQALLSQLQRQREEGRKEVEEWEKAIAERELAEKRRKAPGWLDGEVRILEPEKKGGGDASGKEGVRTVSLMDERTDEEKKGDELGDAMDKAFGKGLGS